MSNAGTITLFERLLLGIPGTIFFSYGLVCLFFPSFAAEVAGLQITNADGHGEIAAMYGGFQASFGAILLASARMPAYTEAGLWLIAICIGALGAARGVGMLLAPTGLLTSYSYGAVAFELGLAVLGIIALKRRPA
ncbi:hypothetical protein NOR51B_2523 [Luminiphilus syltensis NOR5-1B]|uniref:DUF4345 domain-containing protein n=1 Tax=Luminiphilus syltensis NOR5-1B TaxID=565045 RepID=B8KXN2_9GAMM|nr:DUF4345 family protein [Luminiphilus syltensis]EED36571.1 hypothetical protein NOR51B_2523 [Luminiphilus syltensis NOR5-1B]